MSGLSEYRRKRDFARTPEPAAEAPAAPGDQPMFVVQKHDARRLHYDLRLEHGGVLWSWAVTRGPSLDPAEKRLAVRTEDHPLAYGSFEGTIPEGEYGGGTVMLWDRGWWEPLHDPAKGLEEGKLHFRLHGARMTGGWALVRMRGRASDKGRENWLLIKERDDHAGTGDALVQDHRTSVESGRSMADIAAAPDPKAAKPAPRSRPLPRFRDPQRATLRDAPPEGDAWWHETKFDGYRCQIALGKGGVRLYSRGGNDWSDRFGSLAVAAATIPCGAALIDGEVIAGGGGGEFGTLVQALKTGGALTYYAFDLLHLDSTDLTPKPLTERRAALERLLSPLPKRGQIRLSPVLEGHGGEALQAICRIGGEGIVSKLADAPYRGGRGTAWIKSKCGKRAEFVIVGWSPSDKRGRPFSSLLLASSERGQLVYRGRVGTGFDEADMDQLMADMAPLAVDKAPVGDVPRSEARGAHWVRPQLVAEVSYAEFTPDGRIRHGVFRGLREDKEPDEVSAADEAKGGAVVFRGQRISSPDRVVFPGSGVTKGDVARHYDRVAERLLQFGAGHPVSLLRCPGGITGECFFQKHAGKGFPDRIETMPVEESDGGLEDYMVLSTPAALMAAVQMGTIEFHLWGSARKDIEKPDRMVFDLDPDEGLDFAAVKRGAVEMRDALAEVGLASGAMVSGGKGVHVIVPLRRGAGWDTVKTFSQTVASVFAQRHPDRFTATMTKTKRKGRIFIDWLRNDRGATAIAPYALRAREGAPVAVPVTWDELAGLDRPNGFHPSDMEARLSAPCPLAQVPARGIGNSVVASLEHWAAGR